MRLSTLLAALVASLPAVASAVSISEGTFGDFGDSFATRSVLPAQTDEISGDVYFLLVFPGDPNPSDADFAAFTDLVPGTGFTLSATTAYGPMGLFVRVLDSAGTLVVPLISLPGNLLGGPQIQLANGIVPLSGELVLQIGSNDFGSSYAFQLDAARVVVPEPGTALLLGFGLALLARWPRARLTCSSVRRFDTCIHR